jgi:hypothetical protein
MADDPMSDVDTKFHEAWLGMVQPIEGLVVSVPVLVDAQCMARNPPSLQQQFLELAPVVSRADDGDEHRAIRDLRRALAELLGLTPDLFHEGTALPEDLSLYVPEGQQTLRPMLALKKMQQTSPPAATKSLPDDSTPASRAGEPYVALAWELPSGLPFDKPEIVTGSWSYPPAAKFDRLLRACRVPIGLLFNGDALRLVYAPHGESSGAITFHVDHMATVGGRPILDAFVMLLHARRLFGVAEEHQLPAILRDSRVRQANVTSDLAGQVFDALSVLVRGFEAAGERDGRALLDDALARNADHLYGGFLAVLLRLVFLLYAEDRGLLPTEEPIYAEHMSLLTLFSELQRDAGTHHDSMSRRFGAWPRLLALFRAVFLGAKHGTLQLPPRRGQLFDPHVYPFLEGWGPAGSAPVTQADERGRVHVPTIDDGTVFEVLRRLLILDKQRLSYRALDVEQIGSVYEALMGYHVKPAAGEALCLKPERVWVTGEELIAETPNRRAAYLEDAAGLAKSALTKIAPLLSKAKTAADALAAIEPLAVHGEARELLRARNGQLIVQPGKERRRTSAHYTPRSLSGPIVRKTLEPLLVAMGNEPTSARLLDLKICDPAMGSGAFLVEACRFLGDQVVAAWTREGELGKVASVHEDVVNHARRLVAQRCLYGVDKNPFAVNLAKLSLWLVTLAKDEPFTFVDHALKHGDSLVGLNLDQVRGFHWKPSAQVEMCSKEIQGALDEAIQLRTRILDLAEQPGTTREKERLLWDSEDALDRVRLLGDLVVGAFFAHESDRDREKERDRRLDLVSAWLREGGSPPDELRALQTEIRAQVPVFHWMTEFPEVFALSRVDPLVVAERTEVPA